MQGLFRFRVMEYTHPWEGDQHRSSSVVNELDHQVGEAAGATGRLAIPNAGPIGEPPLTTLVSQKGVMEA
jgi:hypothetical protein